MTYNKRVMAKGRPSGLQGLATMNEAGKVIFRMAYSHVEATGDETKGNPLFNPFNPHKQTSKTAQTTSQRVFGSLYLIRVNIWRCQLLCALPCVLM
jgi:hypothetical protein